MAAVSFTNKTPSRSLLAGNVGFGTGYEHIQSITVGSLGASSVTFSEIPQYYRHLQVRGAVKSNRSDYGADVLKLTMNGDTTVANYRTHRLSGDGGTAASATDGNQPYFVWTFGNVVGANVYGTFVTDILDYTSTIKNKTVRTIGGWDNNGVGSDNSIKGYVQLMSMLWMQTSAVTALNIAPNTGTSFIQYSTFSLYGIR